MKSVAARVNLILPDQGDFWSIYKYINFQSTNAELHYLKLCSTEDSIGSDIN
jgi:hypothetical protein